MATVINGNTGIDKVQDGSIHEADINADVARLGVGQTWQNVTASRALGTTYTNSTGKPIIVHVTFVTTVTSVCSITVNGQSIAGGHQVSGYNIVATALVPNGATYSASTSGVTLLTWQELR